MGRDWLKNAEIRRAKHPLALAPSAIFASVEPQGASAGLNASEFALVLTHKRPAPWLATRPKSSSAMVFSAPAPERAQWLRACNLIATSEDPLRGASVVAEDASPDTCLALVILARLHAGLNVSETWIEYANRWESGDTSGICDPMTSWATLHSALVHPYFGTKDEDLDNENLAVALRLGCAFADGLIAADIDPAKVDPASATDLELAAQIDRARAHLRTEQALAENIAEVGEIVQLALEIEGSSRRHLVDAVILTEVQAFTGAMKVFLRNTPNSPGGDGYAFMALHRPQLKGTGNDITFSIDPRSKVILRDVWEGLELSEWQAWKRSGSARPDDNPRPLASFRRPIEECKKPLPAGIRASDQPWYDGGPLYSLVAAPRFVNQREGILGSKLSWEEALAVLWSATAPSQLFDFRSLDTPAERVDLTSDVTSSCRQKLGETGDLWLVKLAAGEDAQRHAMFWNTTNARTVAAYVAGGRSEVLRLPRTVDFDVVNARGGVVQISRYGAAIVQLSPDASFPTAELEREIRLAAELQALARSLEDRLNEARKETVAAVASGASRKKARAVAAIYAIVQEALTKATPFPVRSLDPVVAAVQDKMEERWGAQKRFLTVVEQAHQLREMVVAASDIRTNEIVHGVAIYGFPFAILVNFFAFAAANEESFLRGLEWKGIEIWPLVAWLACGVALAAVLHGAVLLRNAFWRRGIEELSRSRGKAQSPVNSTPHSE